jgi:D-serine deaminase-like pyridoxal phosphate-dependent protein
MNFSTPTLIVNKTIALNNLDRMIDVANKNNLILRPHFKTHQSIEIGNWFKEKGVTSITVSSITMAEFFSSEWDDITIAFPLNILEIDKLNFMIKRNKVKLLIDSISSLKILNSQLEDSIEVYLKIDVGYNRAGLKVEEKQKIRSIIEFCKTSEKISFLGFLAHFGDSYKSRNKVEIKSVFEKSIERIKILSDGFPNYQISIGDTPTCSTIEKYPEFINEIRPGNFIFYDLAQYKIGSCEIEDISIRMICPVVSIYEEREEVLIYGGSVHFSKDILRENGNDKFGYVYFGEAWDVSNKIGYIKSLSQEHGIVKLEKKIDLKIGDQLNVIPVHSCLAVDKMGVFYECGKRIEIMK